MLEVVVIGMGISGLMSAVMLAQSGAHVTMLSCLEAMRSASCMAQGGINAAEPRENDTPWKHFEDTVASGGWLADQPGVLEMCEFAPDIVSMYDRIGVVFNRHADGFPDTRFFGGTKYKRTHYADTMTGFQLLSALDGQAGRLEAQGRIRRISGRDFVSALIDGNGRCCGCIVQDIHTMKLEAYTGAALVIASGSYAGLYGWSTTAVLSNGAVTGQLLRQGVKVANPEFVQFHPTAMAEGDKPRLISESARGEGGRLWVMREGRPWYFLEEMFPELGNLVARDTASQAIYRVVSEMGLGIGGKRQVYLDITGLPDDVKERKLSNVMDLYRKFSGEDPGKVPMRVFPAPHYSMGGICVDKGHRTEVAGLYACGECDFMYHGANRLGGNSLLSATYGGYVCANTIREDFQGGSLKRPENKSWIEKEVADREKEIRGFSMRSGRESASDITRELGGVLTECAGIVRSNSRLREALSKADELLERWSAIAVQDSGAWANSSVVAIRKARPCIVLAQAIIAGALARNESRGAHYKPEFPERDDVNWLKTTVAAFEDGKISLRYKPVDTSILCPGNCKKEG